MRCGFRFCLCLVKRLIEWKRGRFTRRWPRLTQLLLSPGHGRGSCRLKKVVVVVVVVVVVAAVVVIVVSALRLFVSFVCVCVCVCVCGQGIFTLAQEEEKFQIDGSIP